MPDEFNASLWLPGRRKGQVDFEAPSTKLLEDPDTFAVSIFSGDVEMVAKFLSEEWGWVGKPTELQTKLGTRYYRMFRSPQQLGFATNLLSLKPASK